MASQEKFRHIVRIANSDLDGSKPVYLALTKIRGVSFMYSNMVCHHAGIEKTEMIGKLDSHQIDKIREVIDNIDKYGIPAWMKNRRKDYEDGDDKHLLDADLKFTIDNDIKRLKKIRAYRGYRHAFGLPSRGQRTKSNFRRNKGRVVGVSKRKGAKGGRV